VALRLLDGDASIEQAVRDRTLGDLARGAVPAPPAQTPAPVLERAS
jgi:hypothetical protein